MKKVLSLVMALVFVLACCCTGCAKGSTDYSQIFERYIAGDQIQEYIPFGSEGLIGEYEYVEHVYHYGDSKAYLSIFRTAYIFDTAEHAEVKFKSLQRTYKEDVVQVENKIYLNQNFENSNVETITGGQRTYDELFDYMAEHGYILIEAGRPE